MIVRSRHLVSRECFVNQMPARSKCRFNHRRQPQAIQKPKHDDQIIFTRRQIKCIQVRGNPMNCWTSMLTGQLFRETQANWRNVNRVDIPAVLSQPDRVLPQATGQLQSPAVSDTCHVPDEPIIRGDGQR